MTRRTVRGVVVLGLVLAVSTLGAAPVSALTIDGGDSGTTIGDHLDDDTSSGSGMESSDGSDDGSATGSDGTDESTDDSSAATDSGTSSGNTTTAPGDSSDNSSENSSDGDASTSGGSGNDSAAGDRDSGDHTADNSTEEHDAAAVDSTDAGEANRTLPATPIDAAANVSAAIVEGLRYDLVLVESIAGTTDGVRGGGSDDPETGSLDTATTEDASDTAGESLGAILDGTSGLFADFGASIAGDGGADGTASGTRDVAAMGTDAVAVGGEGSRATGGDGSRGVPPESATGAAVGIGAVVVAGAARKGALLPGGLSSLGSALTAGVLPVAGRTGVLDRLVRMLAPLRYSRYDDSDPLEHEARAEVYEVVDGAPGAYLSEVADRAGLPLSTARHHIRVLEREDLVSGTKVRGKRRFYPAYTSGIELAAALNDEATAAVIDAVARFGSASVSDLAEELDRDPSTVSHHLSRLAEDDIVVRERDGRAVMNTLSPEARTALAPDRTTDTTEVGEALASD